MKLSVLITLFSALAVQAVPHPIADEEGEPLCDRLTWQHLIQARDTRAVTPRDEQFDKRIVISCAYNKTCCE
jgi:hypothetical protein